MNKGIEILLERMKSNPEEFVDHHWHGESKWGRLIDGYRLYLPKEDLEIFEKAYQESVANLMQQRFTEDVMKELLDPKSETNPYIVKSAMHSGGQTLGRSSVSINNTNAVSTTLTANSLTLGKTTVTDTQLHELLHMKAQMELERQKQKEAQADKAKTLFGKLFNYQ